MSALSAELRERMERLLGERIASESAVFGGYTPAARWLVRSRSGKSAFAKVGTTPFTSEALHREHAVYSTFEAPCVPRFLGWDDHPEQPLLLIEDLSTAHWPPPWDAALVAGVRETLETLHRCSAPLSAFEQVFGRLDNDWQAVAKDPAPFLSLQLTSEQWLQRALPALIDASSQVRFDGDEVTHFDVRSDNICRTESGIVLVDWALACLGNGALDLGCWLPSLEAEGGPPPEALLPGRGDIAAWVCGYFAARAGLPPIPDAPRVRVVQLQQLERALPWVCRALGCRRSLRPHRS